MLSAKEASAKYGILFWALCFQKAVDKLERVLRRKTKTESHCPSMSFEERFCWSRKENVIAFFQCITGCY